MLTIGKINPNVTVTLNIGLNASLNWGGYKAHIAQHGTVNTLVDVLDAPHRIARIIEAVKHLTYNPNCGSSCGVPINTYGIDYGNDDGRDIKYKIVQSETEATLVVQFEAVGRDIVGQVFGLANVFKQDCIALWIHNDVNSGIGQLIGRYNYVWGDFKNEYFIHI